MKTHHTQTTLSEDGVVILQGIPFLRGESVEVIVVPLTKAADPGNRYPLHGTPVKLLAPSQPVADGDWEVVG
jgi:hypothetical protein